MFLRRRNSDLKSRPTRRQASPFKLSRFGRALRAEALECRHMLSAAGLLDPTFGAGGIVTLDLYPNTSANEFAFESGRAIESYVVDGETKTVVAGQVTDLLIETYWPEWSDMELENFIYTSDVFVARYNEDGSLDATFGTGGVTRIDLGDAIDYAFGIAVDSQGRVIVGGRSGDDMVAARLAPSGALDSTFGSGGTQVIEFDGASSAVANDLAVDEYDRVILAGAVSGPTTLIGVARLLSETGALDPNFGVGGTQTVDIGGQFGGSAEAVAIDHLGRIVMAGSRHDDQINVGNPYDFAIVRLTAGGAIDTTFGLDADGDLVRDGWTSVDFNSSEDYATGIGIDALNRVIVGGTSRDHQVDRVDFGVVRLTASGELDASFGLGGKQTIAVDGHAERGVVAVDQFGRTVIAGSVSPLNASSLDMAAARLSVDGSLDLSFGNNGTLTFGEANLTDRASGVEIDPQGRVLLTGDSDHPATGTRLAVVRLSGDNDPPLIGNQPPAVSADHLSVLLDYGQVAANTGAFGDLDGDSVTLTASAGNVLDNGDGTWSWSINTPFEPGQQVTITATDAHGDVATAVFHVVGHRTQRAGFLDETFSGYGKLYAGLGYNVRHIGFQSDGKFVAAYWNNGALVVIRYNVDGSVDPTFGVDGQVLVDNNFRGALTVDAQDRIVLGGEAYVEGEGWGFGVRRLMPEGEVDVSFGDNGLVYVPMAAGFGTPTQSVAIDSQRRIIVAGHAYLDGGVADFAVARLTENGQLDFKTTIDFGVYDQVDDMTVDSQDRIILVGATINEDYTIHASNAWNTAMVRLSESGEIDLQQTIDFGLGLSWGNGVAVDSQDQIVLASSQEKADGQNFRMVVRRLTATGALDWQKPIEFGRTSVPSDVAVDSQDRIVIAGSTSVLNSGDEGVDAAVARLSPSGEFDTLFGAYGKQTIEFGGIDNAYGIAFDSQGRIFIAGDSDPPGETSYQPVISRLTSGNDAVSISRDNASVLVDVGQLASLTGAFVSIDGTAILLTASVGTMADNGDGTWNWSFAATAPIESQMVTVTATDLYGVSSSVSFQLTVRLAPVATPAELAQVVENIPPGATEVRAVTTTETINDYVEIIAELPPNVSGEVFDIVLNLEDGDYQEPHVISVPEGYRVIINGTSGQVVFHGNSPSLIVASGEVLVTGVTFVNATDSPTILVTGGSLVLRDTVVQETAVGNRAGIEVTGGTVDLGTAADPGGNTFEVRGAGSLVSNASGQFIAALGNAYLADGSPLASAATVEARVLHGLDAPTLGIVGFADAGLFVAVTQAAVTATAGSHATNAGSFGAFGVDGVTLSASLGSVTFAGDGSWTWSYQTAAGVADAQTIEITAIDTDGNVASAMFSLTVTAPATGVSLVDGVLTIRGSDTAGDIVGITRLLNNIVVIAPGIDGPKTFAFSSVTEIRVEVGGGNDIVATTSNVTKPMFIDGGSGNDVLTGGGGANTILGGAGNDLLYGASGADILLGGDGDDLLFGGQGRDFIVGGDGADTLLGNADQDLLVSGTTDFDAQLSALASVMTEWNSSRSYAQRTANISGTGTGVSYDARLNGQFFLNANATNGPVTVHDDNDRDTLSGDAGRDWFFANLNLDGDDDASRKDRIADLSSNELAIDLDYVFAM